MSEELSRVKALPQGISMTTSLRKNDLDSLLRATEQEIRSANADRAGLRTELQEFDSFTEVTDIQRQNYQNTRQR